MPLLEIFDWWTWDRDPSVKSVNEDDLNKRIIPTGIAKATPIHTSLNPSDIGTKPSLSISTFQRHVLSIMGPQQNPI